MATYEEGAVTITNVWRRRPATEDLRDLPRAPQLQVAKWGMTGGPSLAPHEDHASTSWARIETPCWGMVRQGNKGGCREGPGVCPPKSQESAQALDKWS